MKLGKNLINNLWLKVIALIFAITTWFYVFNEIEMDTIKKSSETEVYPSYSRMISRKLYVKAIFIGEPPPGYELVVEKVQVDPLYFVVAGPKDLLKDVDKFETQPINISWYKKTTVYESRLAPIAPSLKTEDLSVKVTIPIKKIEAEK